MRIKDIDYNNHYEVWKFLSQPVVLRLPNETDEHYRKRLLKYMDKYVEDNQ